MKFTKRMATILMALAMMLCLTVPAFAAENAKLIVKGDQLNGKTVHATKMFTASWVDSNNDGKIDAKDKLSYTLDTAWEGLFWANGISTGTKCPAGSINVTSQEGATLNEKALAYVSSLKDEGETKTLVEFAATAAKYKTTNNIEDTAAKKAENDDSVTFDQLTPGYYLVQPEKGSTSATRKTDAMLVNIPSDRAAELQLKSEYPSVEKKVDTDKTESSAQIGQKVNFTLTSKVPDMSEFDTYYFAFKDTMSKGLTFDESSVTVTIGEQKLTKVTDFTVTTTKDETSGATNITIEILNMKTKYADKAGKTITVTYSATLNKDAVVGNTGNTNSAKVEYQNGPNQEDHGTSNPSITTTRTYPVNVQKHAFEDNNADSFLAGAKFALSTSKTVPTFTKGENGSYTLENSDTNVVRLVGSDATYRVAEKNDEAGAVTYFTTVGTSATTINGLKAGTYYLHEIEAPEGYNKLTAPVKVTITETKGKDGKVTGVTYKVGETDQSTNDTVKVVNKTGSMLPSTGGMGTIGLTALGVGIVALGVLAPKKKKEKQ
ncbi:SpaH/EbpB family LPXTG-anchored major pilin [Gemmiger formicilis]|uniref:SpaH/EbpB family LPXTG-anchored major pilin n=1 Tax=Gemmiger formicilis TaxID=745368 RepID=UPI0022E62EC2|nr:SpaH/EbpB family LPXTG-anchored major pilin [Gemmiger formicilis]